MTKGQTDFPNRPLTLFLFLTHSLTHFMYLVSMRKCRHDTFVLRMALNLMQVEKNYLPWLRVSYLSKLQLLLYGLQLLLPNTVNN